jgi:hypothetical protein
MEPSQGLKSFEDYKKWVAEHCKDWQLVQTLYNKQEKIASVLSEHTKNGKRFFEVLWRPTYIRNKHIEFYEKNTRYRPSITFAINPAESPNPTQLGDGTLTNPSSGGSLRGSHLFNRLIR